MKLPIYQVDAFADKVFRGNPAAVCPLPEGDWPSDTLMADIAEENNLSETAFFKQNNSGSYDLRWFTPAIEVDLCGHATLATAHILFSELGFSQAEIRFQTRSGELKVAKHEKGYMMDFPAQPPKASDISDDLVKGLGITPLETFEDADIIAILSSEQDVRDLRPDFRVLGRLKTRGIIATAKGDQVDFVSRFFGPAAGIDEDPVTGSAHCELTPLWAERLGKTSFIARQISNRGGELGCELHGKRVRISGSAITYLRGEIWV